MNVSFISEDENDAVVLGVIVERLVEQSVNVTPIVPRRGVEAVMKLAPHLVREAARSRSSLIVVVVDCDGSTDHFSNPTPHANCRLCALNERLPTSREVEALSNGNSTALASLTVRTLESWLAVAGSLKIDGDVRLFGQTVGERRKLKSIVYGDDQPPSELVQSRGRELFKACNVDDLVQALPSFRHFADAVRRSRETSR